MGKPHKTLLPMDRMDGLPVTGKERIRIRENETMNQCLAGALAGDEASRAKLFTWVHAQASAYYVLKIGIEPLLTLQDAQDLASECVVEFSKCWTRVRSVSHYCRRMYKNNLCRFLNRKRSHLSRECHLVTDELNHFGRDAISVYPTFEVERYSDDDHRMLAYISREMHSADSVMQDLIHYRITSGSLTYAELGQLLGATETSLRMRMARFTKRIRLGFYREEAQRTESLPVAA